MPINPRAYKLIALDMDGTLLNSRHEISAENRKWIRAAAERGLPVVLATSRPMKDVADHLKALQLEDPIIASNGSEIWQKHGVLHRRYALDARMAERALSYLGGCSGIKYWFQYAGGQWDYSMPPPTDARAMEFLQIAVQAPDAGILQDIRAEFAAWNAFDITSSYASNMECNAPGRNKASGLRDVCELLGIGIAEVMAFGDSLNDLAMLRAAGLGVAMGNAREEVKQAADVIAPTNDEDGVARMIRRYIFADFP